MKPIALPNAPWWLNHSHVLTKGRMTAGDTAAITNSLVSAEIVNGTPVMITRGGNLSIEKVKRMVTSGTVAVMLDDGEKHEVHLPEQAEDLLDDDLTYICAQIDAKGRPMNAEELKAFLASQNAHSETHSNLASLSPMTS